MVLKLYGTWFSNNTRRVMLILEEKQVAYEFIIVDLLAGEHKQPGYLAKQPFGVAPYIDDDGFVLYESRAICQYIAEKYAHQGTQLIPSSLEARALYYQAASFEATVFNDNATTVVIETFIKPLQGLPADREQQARCIAALEPKLDAYEAILSKTKYLAGNDVTLADLYHLPHGENLFDEEKELLERRPNLKRWWNSIQSRPAWTAVKAKVDALKRGE